jgi:hypothetical protein
MDMVASDRWLMAGTLPGRSVGPKVARLALPLKDGKRLLAGSQGRTLHVIGLQGPTCRIRRAVRIIRLAPPRAGGDSTSNNHSSSDAVYLNIR